MGKLVAIETYDRFTRLQEASGISDRSLTFILDTGQLYTHGLFFNVVSFGTSTNLYVPLNIAGTTKNLSLAGHTHSNYYAKDSDIDIGNNKIVSGQNDILKYINNSIYLGNSSNPTYFYGTLKTIKSNTEYTILDTNNFSVESKTITGFILLNVATIKYGTTNYLIDYVKRLNVINTLDNLATHTNMGTTNESNIPYGFLTMYTDGEIQNPKYALLRVNINTGALEVRSSGSTTWKPATTDTWKPATTSLEGYVPMLALNSTNTITTQASEYVLTYKSGTETAPVWRKLPTNAFNDHTYTGYDIVFLNSSGTTVDTFKALTSPSKTLKAGTNIGISAASNVITITATDTRYTLKIGTASDASNIVTLITGTGTTTGTILTLSAYSASNKLATMLDVSSAITSMFKFQNNTDALPTGTLKVGYGYRVNTAFTLAASNSASGNDEVLEPGDLIICTDATTPKYLALNTNWTVINSAPTLGTTAKTIATVGGVAITAALPSASRNGSTVTAGIVTPTASGTEKFLREDGTWVKPSYIANTDKTGIKLAAVSGTKKTDSTVIIANSSTGLSIAGGTNKFSIGDGTNYIEVSVAHGLSTKNISINGTNYAVYTSANSLPTILAPTSYAGTGGQVLATNSNKDGLTWVSLPTKSSWNYDDRYVTSLAINGNSLRWIKNGSNNDITIPYATNADTVDGLHANQFVRWYNNHTTNPNIDSLNTQAYILGTDSSYGEGTKPEGSNNAVGIINICTHGSYYSQLALETTPNRLYMRSAANGAAFGSWAKVAFVSDIPSNIVNTFGTKTGNITILGGLTTNGSINLVMSGNQLLASIVGLGNRAFDSTSYLPLAGGTMTGDAGWTADNHKLYFYNNAAIGKPSGHGLTLYGLSNTAIVHISDGTNYYDVYHKGNLGVFVKSGSTAAAGLVPKPDTTAGTTKFLCEDGTWKTPTYTSDTNTWREIKVNGTQKRSTAITSGDLDFINGSNTTVEWTAENKLKINSTWTAWVGATSNANGTAGYMPAPTSALRGQFLRGDGSWVSLNNYTLPKSTTSALGGIIVSNVLTTAVTLTSANGSTANRYYGVLLDKDGKAFVNIPWIWNAFTAATANAAGTAGYILAPAGAQGKYFRGDNTWQTIEQNVTTSLYFGASNGTGNAQVSPTPYLILKEGSSYTRYKLEGAGGITVSSDASGNLKFTGTTYSVFGGASSSADGSAGLVKKPVAGDQGKFLRGDCTWQTINLNVTSALYVGASNGTSTAAQTAGNVHLIFAEGSTYTRYKITGSGRASVTSDANGVITINSSGYNNFTAATSSAAGSAGLVPGPGANVLGSGGYFLRADGSWAVPANTWKAANTAQEGYVPKLATGGGTIATQSTEYVLTFVSGGSGTIAPVWKLLPANAFNNTWTANALNTAGYVAAPTASNANMVWKCDADGKPGWRTDANTWNANAVGVAGYVAAPTKAANANMTWQTDANGSPAWRASNNHSHSYLPLSGGTMTGSIKYATTITGFETTHTGSLFIAKHTGAGTPVPFIISESSSANNDDGGYGVLLLQRMNTSNGWNNAGAGLYFCLKNQSGGSDEVAGISGINTEGGKLIFRRRSRTEMGYMDSTGLNITGNLTVSNNINVPNTILFSGTVGGGTGTYITKSSSYLFLAANQSGHKIYLESTYLDAPYFRNLRGDYTIIHSGNINNYSIPYAHYIDGYTSQITVEGDPDTYYPVRLPVEGRKTLINTISVWRNLGSASYNYPGNHSNGTCSCWYEFVGRYNAWDGNGGYYYTRRAWYGYARVVSHAEAPGGPIGFLIIWLRGGGTLYNISTNYPQSGTLIYYERTNASGSELYPSWVEPRTDIGNEGIINGTFYGNCTGSAGSVAWGNVTSKPSSTGSATQPVYWNGSGFTLANSYPTKASWNYDDVYVKLTGSTMTGPLKINATPSQSNPPLQICYTADYTATESTIGLLKFGAPTYDSYLGIAPTTKTCFGKVGYFYHIGNGYEFDWMTSSWTKLMALECSTGNLWIKGNVGIGTTSPSYKLHIVGQAFASNGIKLGGSGLQYPIRVTRAYNDSVDFVIGSAGASGDSRLDFRLSNSGSGGGNEVYIDLIHGGGGVNISPSLTIAGNKAWHAGNDGSDSGLDADLLDGYHETSFYHVKTEFGGRNYYKNSIGCSGQTKDPSINGYIVNSSNGINRISNLGFDSWIGDWTVSFYIKADSDITVNVNLCDTGADTTYNEGSGISVTTSYVKHKFTFINVNRYNKPSDYNGFLDIENSNGVKFYVKDIKIEKGVIATDWTPAPEDLINANNISSQSVNYANSAGSVAWENITGKPLSDLDGKGPVWGNYVPVRHDGIMEIGKYIDFHNTSNDGVDYAVRLMCLGNNQVIVNLPTSAGTLALTSLIPTKASWNYDDVYLKLSGGTVTGDITLSNLNKTSKIMLTGYNNRQFGLKLTASGSDLGNNVDVGWDWSTTAGSGAFFRSVDAGGDFGFYARNASSTTQLKGTATGSLTWGDNAILTAANYSSYALPLTGGTLNGGSSANPLNIDTTESSIWLEFKTNGALKGDFGYSGGKFYMSNYASGLARICIKDDKTPIYMPGASGTEYTLLHTGNYSNYIVTLDTSLTITACKKFKMNAAGDDRETVYYNMGLALSSYGNDHKKVAAIGMGNEDKAWYKAAIGFERTGAYDTGDIVLLFNNTADNTTCAYSDIKVRINAAGNINTLGTISAAGISVSGNNATINNNTIIHSGNIANYLGTASYIEGTNDAASPAGALLRSGAGRADNATGDTWLFYDSLGGTSAPWGIKHDLLNNNILFYGNGSITSSINLLTGNITATGGTITGPLVIHSSIHGNFEEGIRITRAADNWAGITFGSTGASGAPTNGWFVATNPSNQFIIEPDDSASTNGLCLNKNGNLYWRNNVVIHSGNISSYASGGGSSNDVNGVFTIHNSGVSKLQFDIPNVNWANICVKSNGEFYFYQANNTENGDWATMNCGPIYVYGVTNNAMGTWTNNPKVVFAERVNGSTYLRVALAYTDYDSYRDGKGLKVLDYDGEDPNVWFEVGGNCYASNFYVTSDITKKTNISTLSEHIRKFTLRSTGKEAYGVIAQEVPEMFREGKPGDLTVNYSSILSYYVGLLENKVKELELKVFYLELRLNS